MLTIVDEACREYADPARIPDAALELLGNRLQVVALRTFSKAYGPARLRVGYFVAPPEIATHVRMAGLVFDVPDSLTDFV
ncbi:MULTISPECIES: aminotransferase class I/II-fold pyridoxal phosphate-dependent enzyme [Streptomyces]|uniref:Histidinol-phosphate aminotransferase n=1 Tax=Streptomyces stelliscabiei TaxID=146820 RepID=A0A8I0TP39_9ACTN|nr:MULTISPECIES: aminotransferase class I/II-fold pyridoxal phosphate-dependent enzyme [Streptomyces]KND41676.1 hypothetical protein IQ64_28050 [Streptomyces stelliscabiei]MBE1594441.1 histidinol-phosphate aminotransferase [Streptomyces stelliscabiei]MDX2518897.1 aminotransferase class I/II-fold pyridoxal phosphate-dependent enzyme [Streptomyces stelliscabiei]MDX2556472.1 aminotransferase class I/II-fold pyridoxal phosphate-dependent enzyme [Streptomyces stelliscabiei]MDX2615152.1 aminotransfe